MPQVLRTLALLPALLLAPALAWGQSLVVEPYLQDVTQDSAWVMWETDTGAETRIEWGPSPALGTTLAGTSWASGGGTMLHEVQLTGLAAATRYHYTVHTGPAASTSLSFQTPPPQDSDEPFSFIVITDTQDWSGGKFQEIVDEGMVPFVCGGDAANCVDQGLSFVLVAGDLVVNGNSYGQFEERYFDPAAAINGRVPFYPVLGNHEVNSPYYFDYGHLPNNGTPGFEEHWWTFDRSNVRIVGLDSNPAYRIDEQLDWLDGVLADACTNPDIDFAFALFHHGFKSELWTPGEADYSGEIVRRMEAFSETCDKPSGHFFGHTHGYSRGQSRDVSHVWMNAGSASGAIDYWGDWPTADYPEFQRSFDEWGFTFVEVTTGMDPTVRLRRVSRGDDLVTLDNEVKDDLMITLCPREPEPPAIECPEGPDVDPDGALLQAGTYTDPDGLAHLATHFQVSDTPGDFSSPVRDAWVRAENWYYDVDTQAGVDITSLPTAALEENTTYSWRVRYRNVNLCWSRWSAEGSFTTGDSRLSDNLLTDPGAESGNTAAWTADAGVIEALLDGECGGTTPFAGDYYYAVGALCVDNAYGEAHQNVDLSAWAAEIDAGEAGVLFRGQLSDWSGADIPAIHLVMRNGAGGVISQTDALQGAEPEWRLVQAFEAVPPMTRSVDFVLTGTRNAGDDNDSYFDELFLGLSTMFDVEPSPCKETDCTNGLDDDGDTDIDCADVDCAVVDVDGDARPDCEDCLPLDPGTFASPVEVSSLRVSKPDPSRAAAAIDFSAWDVAPQSGTSTVNDLFSGRLSELHADRGFTRALCLANDQPVLVFTDDRPTETGDGDWYLVRAQNACGRGPVGADSNLVERALPVTPCD